MDWTKDEIEELRKLWHVEPQLSTAEIGRRLNKTKNAVVSKVARIHLPHRESPIKTTKPIQRRKVRRAPTPKPDGTGRYCLSCGGWFLSPQPKSVNRRCFDCHELLNSNGASFLTIYEVTVLMP